MFKPTPTWPNFDFGQLFIWIEANNDQIWLPRAEMSYFEQRSNWLNLTLFYFWLEARWMIFSNIRTDFNWIFGQFSVARKLILNGGPIRPTGLLFSLLDGP